MNYFMTRLYENGLFHCVNKIILADHGETHYRLALDPPAQALPFRHGNGQ